MRGTLRRLVALQLTPPLALVARLMVLRMRHLTIRLVLQLRRTRLALPAIVRLLACEVQLMALALPILRRRRLHAILPLARTQMILVMRAVPVRVALARLLRRLRLVPVGRLLLTVMRLALSECAH